MRMCNSHLKLAQNQAPSLYPVATAVFPISVSFQKVTYLALLSHPHLVNVSTFKIHPESHHSLPLHHLSKCSSTVILRTVS